MQRQSLFKHKKKCTFLKEEEEKIVEDKKEEGSNYKDLLILAMTEMSEMRKENNELVSKMATEMTEMRKEMTEMIPKIGNNNNNNNNNKTFNLQVFLNEDCKDALNMTDFLKTLHVSQADLIDLGTNGFVESTARILIKGLSKLDITKRPIHCSDLKRETLYIKDNDVWTKESDNKENMKRMVLQIQGSNFKEIADWVEKRPWCSGPGNDDHEMYMEMIGNTAGLKYKDNKIVNKIVKKVAKEVMIDRQSIMMH
jgi:hypothetical protein